jgi:predicted enzyme related to lactoylglutathione lyase
MRTALLAMTLPLAFLLVAQVESDAKKPDGKKPDVGPGHVAWFDITTTNMQKSRDFYGKLFDWKFTALAGTDLAVEIVAGDLPIGTLRRAEGAISAFNGVVYVQVPDIEVSCKKARELGATIVPGFPFDLQDDKGAIGLFTDPAGHPMGMYSRTPLAKVKPVK